MLGPRPAGLAAKVLDAAPVNPALAAAYRRQLAASGSDEIMGVKELLYVALKMRVDALWHCAQKEGLDLPHNCPKTVEQVALAWAGGACVKLALAWGYSTVGGLTWLDEPSSYMAQVPLLWR
jgi:hypothetical protein